MMDIAAFLAEWTHGCSMRCFRREGSGLPETEPLAATVAPQNECLHCVERGASSLIDKIKKGACMQTLATTRMSSRGQVVIPEDIRNRLNLEAGAQFVVVGEDDVVILKTIKRPSMKEFDKLVREARRQAHAAGMKRTDISRAIARVRGRE